MQTILLGRQTAGPGRAGGGARGGEGGGGASDARGRGGARAGPGLEAPEALRGEEPLVPVLAEARGVDARSIGEEKAGLLFSLRTEAEQPHDSCLPACRQRSTATAATMMTPISISCTYLGQPICWLPLRRKAMVRAPTIEPR